MVAKTAERFGLAGQILAFALGTGIVSRSSSLSVAVLGAGGTGVDRIFPRTAARDARMDRGVPGTVSIRFCGFMFSFATTGPPAPGRKGGRRMQVSSIGAPKVADSRRGMDAPRHESRSVAFRGFVPWGTPLLARFGPESRHFWLEFRSR